MKNILWIIVVLSVFLTGCKTDQKTLTLGAPGSTRKVLIAGDSSDFKQKVLTKVVEKLGEDKYSFKFIGLDALSKENTEDYGAIVLVNTCWADKVDGRVSGFLDQDPKNKKVIVFTSVGGEDWQPNLKVDAVTSASFPDRVEQRATELTELIQKRFK